MSPQLYIGKSGAKTPPSLPADAITRTFGIFGVKDSGKTTTARVLVEEMCRIGGNVVVLDPVGVWWGATRAGEKPGIPGIVIGGEQGDVPLEETGGQLVAELVVGRHWPLVVVDLKLLRKGQQLRFLADFTETVYFQNRLPLHVVFEEADRALPQNPRGMDPTLGRLLGASEDIVKLGRSRGLGSTFVSQRIAGVTKNVVEQVEALVLHRQIGPRDRRAVKDWIESNGDAGVTQKVVDSMAGLDQGEMWLYSPGWLRMLERFRIRRPKTLDSSATPTNEQRAEQEAAPRAKVDIAELRERMAETVERAKANDPRELHRRIEELEREVEAARVEAPAPAPERVFVPDRGAVAELLVAVTNLDGAADEAQQLVDEMQRIATQAASKITDAQAGVFELADALREAAYAVSELPAEGAPASVPGVTRPRVAVPAYDRPLTRKRVPAAEFERSGPPTFATSTNGVVNAPRQRILDTIAWFEAIGVQTPKRAAVGPLAGSTSTSSGFEKNLSGLRTAGLIDYPAGGRLALTDAGRRVATAPAGTPTNADLHEAVLSKLNAPRAAIVRALLAVFPRWLRREELATSVGVSPASSGFEKNLSGLRTLELIDYPGRGQVVAADLLFIG